jgi:hypothetical protein
LKALYVVKAAKNTSNQNHRQNREAFKRRRPINSAKESGSSASRLILGPALAEDIHVVEQHLDTKSARDENSSYQLGHVASGSSILYLTVPRHREGLHLVENPGKSQLGIMENIRGPLMLNAIAL